MTELVHPTAVIAESARVAHDVRVGPYAVIGEEVSIGQGTTIGPHAVLEGVTQVGSECTIGIGAVLGTEPQDFGYAGEVTGVSIGNATVLREYVTVHRATVPGTMTRVGEGCYLMAYVHVAHDCELGNGVTIANAVQLAGHVHIDDRATIGGSTPIHQFVRIGTRAFVGGGSRVPRDVPPYARAAGNPLKLYGVNVVGLRRAGFDGERVQVLEHAFRLLFNSKMQREDAMRQLHREYGGVAEVERLLDFIAASERGVLA